MKNRSKTKGEQAKTVLCAGTVLWWGGGRAGVIAKTKYNKLYIAFSYRHGLQGFPLLVTRSFNYLYAVGGEIVLFESVYKENCGCENCHFHCIIQ